jgi:molybdopterin-binding protein
VPKHPNPAPHKVGDRIRVSMHGGKIVDAVIKAIIDKTDGLHYQIDFGKEQTALVRASQVVGD